MLEKLAAIENVRGHPFGSLAVLAVLAALVACEARPAAEAGLDDLPTLTLESDMRLGSFDDPTLGFTSVTDLDVDADGRIYVLERSQQEIRVFGPEGSLERVIGGEGDGPGEFRGAFSFGVLGDTVWVVDSRADRITLLDREGEVLSTGRIEALPIPTTNCYAFPRPLAMRPDGYFTSSMSRIGGCVRYDEEVDPNAVVPIPRVLFNATGAVVDTVGWDPMPPPRMVRPPDLPPSDPPEVMTVGSNRYRVPESPSLLPDWEAVNDGQIILEQAIASGPDEGAFSVTRRDLEGDTVYRRVIPYRPRPYTDVDLDSIAAQGARRGTGVVFMDGTPVEPDLDAGEIRRATGRLRAAMDFPDFRLPIDYHWVGQDESVWLLRDEPEGVPSPVSRWIVLRPDGSTRGQVEPPPGSRPLWVRGDTFWAVETDDFDVPWLVRYRIEG